MDNRILILGNAPIYKIPNRYYKVVFYFTNNSNFISSIQTDRVVGVIQNFTVEPSSWNCVKWGKIRKQKFIKYKTYFRDNYETILIGEINDIKSGIKDVLNVVKVVNHKDIVAHVLWQLPILRLIGVLGVKGCVNYLLLILNLKTTINGKYRPSSGCFIALYVLNKFKNTKIDLIGFSDPSKEYAVTKDIVLDKSPHVRIDILIFNLLKQKGSIL
jgi:hypothetical protein